MRFVSSFAVVSGIFLAALGAGCTSNPTSLAQSGFGAGGAGGGADAGCTMPAAVQKVIDSCTSCHGSYGSLPRLRTAGDFQKASPNGGTYGTRSVKRMQNKGNPMPPDGVPSAAAVTAFSDWVNGGYQLECPTTAAATGTGGADGSGGAPSVGQ